MWSNRVNSAKRYLLWCVNEHVEFRFPELKSIAWMYKLPIKWIEKPLEDPYVIVEAQSEKDVRDLVSRSMLVRGCYELWGDGCTEESFHSSIKAQPSGVIASHISEEKSFCIRVEGYNKTLNRNYKLARIEMFLGRYVCDGGRSLIARYSLKQRKYIGVTSMDAQLAFIMTNLAGVKRGSVVLDPFVGTGSVLVSAAHHGAFVWGSDIDFLTLHARTKPTRVKQLKRAPDESILANLKQYGLDAQYLGVVVNDCATTAWRHLPVLDAIITDPPYGIRESVQRVGKDAEVNAELTNAQKKQLRRHRQQQQMIRRIESVSSANEEYGSFREAFRNGCSDDANRKINLNLDENNIEPISVERGDNRCGEGLVHYPSKTTYSLGNVFRDLLNFSAKCLAVGGKLVFWLPVNREDYSDELLPKHPCLEVVYNCEQVLNTHSSRRLVSLRKFREATPSESATACVDALTSHFREKFFIGAQMSRDERIARKCVFNRDKRGQGLSHRLVQNEIETFRSDVHVHVNGFITRPSSEETAYTDECLRISESAHEDFEETDDGERHKNNVQVLEQRVHL